MMCLQIFKNSPLNNCNSALLIINNKKKKIKVKKQINSITYSVAENIDELKGFDTGQVKSVHNSIRDKPVLLY